MAMKFGGFTPQQMQLLLPKLGYKGSMQTDEIDMFLAASPRAASQLGRFTETARQMVEGKPVNQTRNMANGGFVFPRKDGMGNVNRLNSQDNPEYAENIDQQMAAVNKLQNTFPLPQEEQRRFAEGGTAYRPPQAGAVPTPDAIDDPAATFLNTTQKSYFDALASQQAARDALAADASNENLLTALTAADSRVAQLNEAVTQAQDQFKQTKTPEARGHKFQVMAEMLALLGSTYEDVQGVLKALGYTSETSETRLTKDPDVELLGEKPQAAVVKDAANVEADPKTIPKPEEATSPAPTAAEAPQTEAPKLETVKTEAPKPAPRKPQPKKTLSLYHHRVTNAAGETTEVENLEYWHFPSRGQKGFKPAGRGKPAFKGKRDKGLNPRRDAPKSAKPPTQKQVENSPFAALAALKNPKKD